MNHLAHLYLSAPEPQALLGNLIADQIKGRDRLDALPEGVRAGVLCHRAIDRFTDAHPAVREAADLFRPRWGRYAPILTDVFFDHALARNWDRYESEPMGRFLARRYEGLRRAAPLVSVPVCLEVFSLIARDVPGRCVTTDGVRQALGSISARARRRIDLRPASGDLARHAESVDALFHRFFPEAVAFARSLPPA